MISSKAILAASDIADSGTRQNTSIGMRLLKASGLVAAGNISSRLIALLISIISARLLTEAEFGALGVIQGTLSLFGTTAGLSLGLGATRYVALHRVNDVKRARAVAIVVLSVGGISSVLTSLVMILLSRWLALKSLHNPELIVPLRWASLQLLLFAGYGFVAGILSGAERFGITATANVFQNTIILAGSVILIPVFRVTGAISAQILGLGCALSLGLWCIRDIFKGLNWQSVRDHFRNEGRLLFDFCLPTVLAGLLIMPASWLALTLIARGPDGYAQVAFFTAADRFRLIIFFIAGFVGTALLPLLSGAYGGDETSKAQGARGLELGLIGTATLVVPLSAVLAFAGPQIMWLFGRAYQTNWAILLPVIAWASTSAIGSMVGTALLAHGKQWFLFVQQLAYGVTLLVAVYLLRDLGAAGLALAHLSSVLLLLLWSIPILRHLDALTVRATRILCGSILMVCALCGFAWLCPPQLRFFLAFPTTGIATLFSILVFARSVEREQLLSFFRLRKLAASESARA